MLKSKRIDDFFSVGLDVLRPEQNIPFSAHLYFEATNHILVWKPAGTVITAEVIRRYQDRGVRQIWVHSSEKEVFGTYALAYDPERTKEALTNEALDLAVRQVAAQQGAQSLLKEASGAQTLDEQNEANSRLRERVRDLIDPGQTFDLVEKISELEHCVDTAVYAVVFAMLGGHVDRSRLSDLAVAGLVHDVGLCLLPLSVLRKSWREFSRDEQTQYASHVRAGLDWLARNAPEISSAQCELVDKHHERPDGTGYPQGVTTGESDLSEVLALSELILSMSGGKIDGRRRTLREAVDAVSELSDYARPLIFEKVAMWCKTVDEDSVLSDARKITHEEKSRLFRKVD